LLKVASPRFLQRNLSRSKTQRLPRPTAFAVVNFPVTDNGEDELVDYLEARLADVLVDASFSSAKKEMVLTFETADDADADRLFFNEFKLETSTLTYAKFINICVEGKSREVELGDNVATKRTLQMDAFPPKRDYPRLSTPSYPDVFANDTKKSKTDLALAGDFVGDNHNALTIINWFDLADFLRLASVHVYAAYAAYARSTSV